jgi:hypothetical protein
MVSGRDRTGDQSLWANSPGQDLEDEHDGREPSEDDEPSLCGRADEAGGGGDDRDLEVIALTMSRRSVGRSTAA